MQKITPILCFDGPAEAAAKFYTSILKESKILKVARYTETGSKVSRRPRGSVMRRYSPAGLISTATSIVLSCVPR